MIEDVRQYSLFNCSSSPSKLTPRLNNEDERGAAGVSSLILFIATILISAIVAGVLLETISDLQEQSRRTGDEAISEVSAGLNTLSVTGDRKEEGDPENPTSDEIEILEIIIRLKAGSKPLDMDGVLIQVDDGNATSELVHYPEDDTAAGADESHFTTELLRDPEGDYEAENVISQGTLVKIYVDADAAGMELTTNTPVDMRIIPEEGQPTRMSFMTPSVYTDRYVRLK